MQYFVRSGALLGFPELLRELGQNPSRLLREAGLSTAVLHDPDLYLPYPKLAQLYERAARSCREPHFGLRLGRIQGLEVVGALASCMSLQATVGDALNLLQKNLDFHARGARIEIDRSDEACGISFELLFGSTKDCTQLIALSVALIAHGIAQLHQNACAPNSVSFAFSGRGSRTAYGRMLGCPVRLDGERNRICYPGRLLTEPVAIAPATRARLTASWRGTAAAHIAPSLAQQVEHAIGALLPTGECSLEMVARIVALHPRTLQSKLKTGASSFGAILQKTRQRLACQHLQQSDTDLTTLAFNLGYAELAVFSRSFRAWTGMSPRDWRAQARQGS